MMESSKSFERTRSKLEDAASLLDRLREVNDGKSFRVAFNSFLSSARAVTYALQKEGRHIQDFDGWYQPKQQQMKKDELLRFMHNARIEDFHKGKTHLSFRMEIDRFGYDQAGPKPQPDAQLVLSGEGPYWIINRGTSREKRFPVKPTGGYTLIAWINNAPTSHLGKPLASNDPITLCQVTLDYLSDLVQEAMDEFRPLVSE